MGNHLGSSKTSTLVITQDFAESFTEKFGEDITKSRFYDGAPGNDPSFKYRKRVGKEQGQNDAETIIQSLARTNGVITEPLILATHSMGAAYGAGFLEAIIEYVKQHPLECTGLSISVYDFDPFQASSLKNLYGVSITQIIHKGNLAEQTEQGLTEKNGSLIDDSKNSDSHAIVSFIKSFNQLKAGSYVWNGSEFVLK